MQLAYDDICRLAHGVARVEMQEDAICFFRFTKAQQETYFQADPVDFYPKSFATAGVRLSMVTDSSFISLRYRMIKASSRVFGWFDLYENGVLIAHFGGDTTQLQERCEEISLSEGQKQLELYFPWSAAGQILGLELEDGATFRPVEKKRTMLAFGDSITQGYDAIYPSRSYQNILADLLDADCINKAIGGEKFFPALLDSDEDVRPALITVAYGSNDWSKRDFATYEENCRGFFKKLTERYGDVRIIAITPIWRADHTRQTPFGAPLCQAVKLIEEICAEFPQIKVVRGGGFTPHLQEFYSDKYLHPNDLGFAFYAENLYPAVLQALEA